MKVAIIGTAGRKDDKVKMSRQLYFRMVEKAAEVLEDICGEELPHLVSGGAAWADHCAVSLFLMKKAETLRLYLPCHISREKCSFYGVSEKETNTAGVAQYYHNLFSKKMGKNTVGSIVEAERCGAKLIIMAEGFHRRNIEVGKVDMLLALTFGIGEVPKDGGTLHTWKNSSAAIKIHIPLGKLM